MITNALPAGMIQHMMIRIFCFQAEDGIRDGHVTGVQTCALPIWIVRTTGGWIPRWSVQSWFNPGGRATPDAWSQPRSCTQIGRASCRERVKMWDADAEISKTDRTRSKSSKRKEETGIHTEERKRV